MYLEVAKKKKETRERNATKVYQARNPARYGMSASGYTFAKPFAQGSQGNAQQTGVICTARHRHLVSRHRYM